MAVGDRDRIGSLGVRVLVFALVLVGGLATGSFLGLHAIGGWPAVGFGALAATTIAGAAVVAYGAGRE